MSIVGNDYRRTISKVRAKNMPKETVALKSSCKIRYNEKYTESVTFHSFWQQRSLSPEFIMITITRAHKVCLRGILFSD